MAHEANNAPDDSAQPFTAKQVMRLIEASEVLAAYFAADACRVIYEFSEDEDLLPWLSRLPIKVVREFDEAIADIQYAMMEGGGSYPEEHQARVKYEAAMKEMREAGL